MAWPGEPPLAPNLCLLLTSVDHVVAGAQEAVPSPHTSEQGQLFLNPACVPNLLLKTFKFQADNLNLSPYRANPLLLNVGRNLLLSLLR